MITAVEALQLPSAQLTPEEIAIVDKLEAELDDHVRTTMGRNGADWHIKGEQSSKVLAELNVRIKRAGFNTNWNQILDKHRLNTAIQIIIGYNVHLSPNDAAYAEGAFMTALKNGDGVVVLPLDSSPSAA